MVENVRKTVPEDEASKINLHAYWKILWRKKFYLIVPFVLAGVIAVMGVKRLTPIYESTTMMSIEEKNVLTPTMERYLQSGQDRNVMRDQQIRAMIETRLKSRDFLEYTVKELGLDRSPELRSRIQETASGDEGGLSVDELVMRNLIVMLREKIKVVNPQPGFVTIGVQDTDPSTAYVLAQKISELFIDVTKQEEIKGFRQTGTFSDEQLAIYKDKLDASEKELARVKREMAGSGVESNPVTAANSNFARALKQTMDAEVEKNDIALKRVRDRLNALFNLVPSSDRISSDEAVMNIERQLDAYGEEKLLNDLRPQPQQEARGTDSFASITDALRSRIKELVQNEYRTVSSDMHPLIVEYFYQRVLLDYYTATARTLQRYIDQYAANLDRTPALERELSRLTQEVETNRALYKAFQEQKTSARIGEAAQTTNLGMNISIIERAEKPLIPVKPAPLKIIIVALFFGGVCGLGTILVTEYIDDSFRSVEEVERVLKVPVLGTVPKMVAEFGWERIRHGKMVLFWIVGIVVFVAMMSGVFFVYGKVLKGSGLGIELREDRPAGEVKQ